ncbi:MAG: hypothetical protein R3330_15760, partial [Saprospiraceae bacterium]|nr:hypothetical protein [Saprospiraceae bacterium]
MLPVTNTTLSPAGRLAIVGVAGVSAFGTAETSYQIRTGRYTDAVPELARLMGLVQAKDGQLLRAQRIVADRAVPVENDDARTALSPAQIVSEYGDYIDHNIGIRVIRPG